MLTPKSIFLGLRILVNEGTHQYSKRRELFTQRHSVTRLSPDFAFVLVIT